MLNHWSIDVSRLPAPLSAPYPLTWNAIQQKNREYIALIDDRGVTSIASNHRSNEPALFGCP